MKRVVAILFSALVFAAYAVAMNCSNAHILPVGETCQYYYYVLYTGEGPACSTDCGWTANGYKDVWLKLTMPETERIMLATEGSYLNGFMAVYTGTCSNLKPYKCSSNGRLPEVMEVSGLPAGSTVYVRVALTDANRVGICSYKLDKIEKPACSLSTAAADYCSNATLIQSPDGYCGNTSSKYSVDAPGNLQNVFCGSIENNSWLQFVAAESEASLNIFVNNCMRGIGIQMRIYGTDDCVHFTPYSNCWNPAIETNGVLTATDLKPGKRYYLMIDGYAGDVCDYTISGGKGVEMPKTFLEESICKGQRYTKYGFNESEAGVYRQELIGPTGKDSLVVLSLSVIDPVYTYLKGSIYSCERYTENGFNVNTQGKHYITRTSAVGCDSIVELDLEVKKQKEHYIYASICSGEVYDQNGFNESEKGVYTRKVKTALGCDSVITLDLDVTATIDIEVTGKTDLCKGDETVLTASGGSYYKWYDADGNEIGEGESITVKPYASTSYKVVTSAEQKCPSSVTDCQGNEYRVVRIGDQCWMAENLRCTMYDTESPRAGERLKTANYPTYAPYYYPLSYADVPENLRYYVSGDMFNHFGLLYNWGAAIGFTEKGTSEGNIYGDVAEDETYQGICPNGWHLPSFMDYYDLAMSLGFTEAAVDLRAKYGWFSGIYRKEKTVTGTDLYGFSLYPAGYYGRNEGTGISDIVYKASLWCCGPAYGEGATYLSASCIDRYMMFCNVECGGRKYEARSVRCVKN